MNYELNLRLVIRVGQEALTFTAGTPQAEHTMATEHYPLNKGISAAANLREAFTTSELLQSGYAKVLLLVDTPVMLVPLDEYQSTPDIEPLYRHAFTLHASEQLHSNVLPQLNAVAVFSVNKDLLTVVGDHFSDVRIMSVMEPVWLYHYEQALTGTRSKLFAYFHDQQVSVFSFARNRFRFSNAFDATHPSDTVYFLLNAWKQLGMNAESDELHLILQETGDGRREIAPPPKGGGREGAGRQETVVTQLRRYVRYVYTLLGTTVYPHLKDPAIRSLPYDVITLLKIKN